MECRCRSKLDKIETDCGKVNLKNIGPKFLKFKSVFVKSVVYYAYISSMFVM